MSATAIEAEELAKRYALGRTEERGYRTLRDALAGLVRPRSRPPKPAENEVWALRDVSFAVAEGEALGVIGHNGAGKSTLLKILSRVTEPSAGRARLRGRVASLLEVGTGFHPELTGRENVFLNGSILGMTRAEIRRSFDAIAAFAEVERFLDTPVKRYSSGMYVRLAFAVAAHLTPEILIVDEVLAVGDHEFQRRCLGRMSEVAHGGRTVLFVSHNLRAVEDLCPRTLLLRGGRIERLGPTREVVAHYLARRAGAAQDDGQGRTDLRGIAERDGTGRARLTRLELLDPDEERPLSSVGFCRPFRVRLHWEARERLAGAAVGLAVVDERDERLFVSATDEVGLALPALEGAGCVECRVRAPNVLPGRYRLEAWILDPIAADYADHVRGVGRVEIVVGGWDGPNVAALGWRDRGPVYVPCDWRVGSGER
jgi:lipopolysaccharide transport system ATP-binding protein